MANPPPSILGGLFREFFSFGWVEEVTKGFHGSLDAFSHAVTSRIVSQIPPARSADSRIFRVDLSNLITQVLQQINEAYTNRYDLHNNFCILIIVKPESWENLSRVLTETISKLAAASKSDSHNQFNLVGEIGAISTRVTSIIEHARTLSETVTRFTLKAESIIKNPNYEYIREHSGWVKKDIDAILELMFSPSFAGAEHLVALRLYWESYEYDLFRFTRWADIDLLAKNRLIVKHEMVPTTPGVARDCALSLLSAHMRDDLLKKMRCHSIHILGVAKLNQCRVLASFFTPSPSSSSSLKSKFQSSKHSQCSPSRPLTSEFLSSSPLITSSPSPRTLTTSSLRHVISPFPASTSTQLTSPRPVSPLFSTPTSSPHLFSDSTPSRQKTPSRVHATEVIMTTPKSTSRRSLTRSLRSVGKSKRNNSVKCNNQEGIEAAVASAVKEFNIHITDLPVYPVNDESFAYPQSSSCTTHGFIMRETFLLEG